MDKWLFGSFFGSYKNGSVCTPGTIDRGLLEDFDAFDIVHADEVKAFDHYAIDNKERCLVGVEAVGAANVKLGILAGPAGLIDHEAGDTSLEGHRDVGITGSDQVFSRDATAYLQALAFLDEAVTPVDELLVFLSLQLVAEADAQAFSTADRDVVGLLFVIDVDSVGGFDIGQTKTTLFVGTSDSASGDIDASTLNGGAGDVGDDAVKRNALLLGCELEADEKCEEKSDDNAIHRCGLL